MTIRRELLDAQLVKKGQTRLEGFEEKILALYARGMTTRVIQAQLQELYGVEVSPPLISNVTEAVNMTLHKVTRNHRFAMEFEERFPK